MLSVTVRKQRGDFLLDARFELPTPGVVALFGRSGCGKSTLTNLIAGLLAADSGSITLDGTVLQDSARGINVAAERRRIGYVFQEARLFPHLNVEANLRYAQRRARAPAFIDLDAVTELLALRGVLARRTHALSGGERQRVAIGRALLTQPQLLLLDEPLASLDAARREEVLPYLEQLRDRLSIPMVYVSHNFEEVLRLATYIVLLENGSVSAQGSIGEMGLNPGLRAIIGTDALGAIVEGSVIGSDTESGLLRVRVGAGELKVTGTRLPAGTRLRMQLLARDIIIATQPQRDLSVRNSLRGTIQSISADDAESDLVTVNSGGTALLARITRAATRELDLKPGMPVWALIKSVTLRGYPQP
jgi:molybdate transport system ATP-binding protein